MVPSYTGKVYTNMYSQLSAKVLCPKSSSVERKALNCILFACEYRVLVNHIMYRWSLTN